MGKKARWPPRSGRAGAERSEADAGAGGSELRRSSGCATCCVTADGWRRPTTCTGCCVPLADTLGPFAHHGLRLEVVSACLGGEPGTPGNPMRSVAERLHRAGIESVVASRFRLSIDGAKLFAQVFYDALLAGPASVESAFCAAVTAMVENDGLVLNTRMAPTAQQWLTECLGPRSPKVITRPSASNCSLQDAWSASTTGVTAEV